MSRQIREAGVGQAGPKRGGPRVALVVDSPNRDLPGLVLLAWRLCQYGAECFLVPMNIQVSEVWAIAPDFVLLNYLRKNNDITVRHYQAARMGTGIIDTEGGIFSPLPKSVFSKGESPAEDHIILPAMEEYALTMSQKEDVRRSISCYCAWTPTFADYAVDKGWYRREQITVTGSPRSDYYAPQWRDAVPLMSEHAAGYPEPMVLINSGFALANPRYQSPEQEFESMVTGLDYDRDYLRRWQVAEHGSMLGLAALANFLAKRFPHVTFVYRPHPFEGEAVYSTLLERLPNLHLVKTGTVEGWIFRAKAVIHHGSTTAIDATMAGVPALTTSWLPLHAPVPLADAVSVLVRSPEDMAGHLATILDGRHVPSPGIQAALARSIEHTFYKVDGNASKRIAGTVLRALERSRSRTDLDTCRAMARGGVERPMGRLAEVEAWDGSAKRFDAAAVAKMVEAIAKVAGSEAGPVEVAPCMERGYRFGCVGGRSVLVTGVRP